MSETPMGLRFERGDFVAWMGFKSQWTCAHRYFDRNSTFCSRPIPDHAVRPIAQRRLEKCGRCERMYKTALKYQETEPQFVETR